MKKKLYSPATTLSKFGQIWHWTNELLNHRNKPIQKFTAIAHMVQLLDDDIKEHFRMALTQSLREEKSVWLRKQIITILVLNFTWDDLEWTFCLHSERRPEDRMYLELSKGYSTNEFDKTVMASIYRDKFTEALAA